MGLAYLSGTNVFLRTKAHKPIVKHVYPKWVDACNEHVTAMAFKQEGGREGAILQVEHHKYIITIKYDFLSSSFVQSKVYFETVDAQRVRDIV